MLLNWFIVDTSAEVRWVPLSKTMWLEWKLRFLFFNVCIVNLLLFCPVILCITQSNNVLYHSDSMLLLTFCLCWKVNTDLNHRKQSDRRGSDVRQRSSTENHLDCDVFECARERDILCMETSSQSQYAYKLVSLII